MALIVVMWTVAALGILVAGLVQAQRGEWRITGVSRAQAQASAIGQAAIQLVAQQVSGGARKVERLERVQVDFAGQAVVVEVMPMVGLIDLNLAPEALLALLMQHAGGLEPQAAQAAAAAIAARRQAQPLADGWTRRFESADELLSLPEVDPDRYARIRALVCTDSAGSGRVHALAASLEVLLVLAKGRADLAQSIADQRDAGSPSVDTTRLEAAFIDVTLSNRYRFSADVPQADGSTWRVVRDIDLRPGAAAGVPWQVLRADVRRTGLDGVKAAHGGG